ncbi:MAG: AAA family ATPase [Chloroflexota bacterium]|nr:AAA family ATPase [Chloroflexota bacterium]
MNEIWLENFRCFRERQTARLAPLTLLVGENSTGKTSFLAMIRALTSFAYGSLVPDFKESPYDLGSFDEIAHHRGAKGGRADSFGAGFSSSAINGDQDPWGFDVVFRRVGTAPLPASRKHSLGNAWVADTWHDNFTVLHATAATRRGKWQASLGRPFPTSDPGERWRFSHLLVRAALSTEHDRPTEVQFTPVGDSPPLNDGDREELRALMSPMALARVWMFPFASAPVRSKPRRTYDPARVAYDPEGDYAPMYLAELHSENAEAWEELKSKLESFGVAAGLFDEISIRPLGKQSEPFQVQVRKYSGRAKGPWRNLVDVGYGVSQALPVLTELFRPDADTRHRKVFLLQQPEVHLHPSAQAALGSLLGEVASRQRQLIVETHSDHLLDRVRMDIRDGASNLRPEDVSILFFERDNLDVHIHPLQIDEQGNLLGAPESYRRFFMEEVNRSLWGRQPVGAA